MRYNAQLPQAVNSTKIAEPANTYNGNYEMLRLEKRNPEARKLPGEVMVHNGGRAVRMKIAESTQAYAC